MIYIAILDVVMLSDRSLLNRDGNDAPQVLLSIKEMLADRRNNIVRREEVGMNEFEANDRLLTLSFPSLFTFGSGIKPPCGVSEADPRHMLLEYDNRFAEARDFCLLLFNQKFRHTALRSVRDSIYANHNRMKAFEMAINTPNLEEDLKKADKEKKRDTLCTHSCLCCGLAMQQCPSVLPSGMQ